MSSAKQHFNKVTLLITHYNRSRSLERLLQKFAETNCSFEEIVVSDDGSKKEHVDYINSLKDKFEFTLVTTPKNGGLGNNINKGQDAVKTEYTLYVQEDFIPVEGFALNFQNGLDILEEDKTADVIRFYAYFKYPFLTPFKNGFSKMVYPSWSSNLDKITMYSDHPHLRRNNFLTKFGRYSEGKDPEKTEYDTMVSFIKKKGKAYFFEQYQSVFEQINTSSEPSTMERGSLRDSDNVFVRAGVMLYRHLKFNYFYFVKI